MNVKALISFSDKLAKEIEFICQSITITDDDILPIRECASFIFAKISEAAEAGSLEDKLLSLDKARDACITIDQMLILMYSTNIISFETSMRIRNSYASIGRNIAARCASFKRKIELQK